LHLPSCCIFHFVLTFLRRIHFAGLPLQTSSLYPPSFPTSTKYSQIWGMLTEVILGTHTHQGLTDVQVKWSDDGIMKCSWPSILFLLLPRQEWNSRHGGGLPMLSPLSHFSFMFFRMRWAIPLSPSQQSPGTERQKRRSSQMWREKHTTLHAKEQQSHSSSSSSTSTASMHVV